DTIRNFELFKKLSLTNWALKLFQEDKTILTSYQITLSSCKFKEYRSEYTKNKMEQIVKI
ncbi:hypothetical protein, partial [Klebsiella pneumoniae]|uniref:hypothetical protein n=1 Tax=Klebsiella pneumoniae TaxID=573 RepID=UPI0040557491